MGSEIEATERLYLDGCEIKRIWRGDQLLLERRTSEVLDGDLVVARVHSWTVDVQKRETESTPSRTVIYPLRDALGSAVLELDDSAGVVNYEEMLPYGGSAFLAGQNARDVAAKDYRYVGKERDDATGLYYFGFRYYAPWIGNWVSPDPSGPRDSFNLYQFALSNPVTFTDDDGLETTTAKKKGKLSLGSVRDVPALFQQAYGALTEKQKAAFHSGKLYLFYDPAQRKVLTLTPRAFAARVKALTAAGKDVGLLTQDSAPAPSGAPSEAGSDATTAQQSKEGSDDAVIPEPSASTAASTAESTAGDRQASPAGSGPGTGGGERKGKEDATGADPATGTDAKDVNAATTPGSGQGIGGQANGGGQGTSTGTSGTGPGSGTKGTGTGGGGTDAGTGTASDAGPAAGTSADTGTNAGTGRGDAGVGPNAGDDPGEGPRSDEARAGVVGGLEGGIDGGVVGGVLTGADTGSPEGRATAGVGSNGFDANGTLDGSRFSTSNGTGSKPGTTNGTSDVRGGRKGGTGTGASETPGAKPTMMDRLTRSAGYLNLEFDSDENGRSGGIPGGMGRFNLGAGGQAAYIGLTLLSFLVGAGEIKAMVKGAWQLGVRGLLAKAMTKLRGVVPAAKAGLAWVKGLATRGAAGVASTGLKGGLESLTKAELIRELRRIGTREAYATVAALKRGVVDLNLSKMVPRDGRVAEALFNSNRVNLFVRTIADVRQAAGLLAHETKHVLQKLTAKTYHKGHEIEAYLWQRRVDTRTQADWPTLKSVWDFVKSSPVYKQTPNAPKGWKPDPNL